MSAFVGVKTVKTAKQLKTLIEDITENNRVFFLRWPHKVSGLSHDLPDGFPSLEGQVFTRDLELRWKAQGQGYSVLLLSETGKVDGFDAVGAEQRYFRDKKTAMVHFVALVAK